MLRLVMALALLAPVGATAADSNPSVEDICRLYKKAARKRFKGDPYAARIAAACDLYSPKLFHEPDRPAFNFRAALPQVEGEGSCRAFRSGQPAPREAPAESTGTFGGSDLGFDITAASRTFGIGVVVDLRFDPTYRNAVMTFGPGAPKLPVSPGEAGYRYEAEKALVEAAGMKSVYAPTIPELEHFIGHYVPRLDRGPGSKPYICRLPSGVPDGASPHWLNEHPDNLQEISALEKAGTSPLLASAFEDCHDWVDVYGQQQVLQWLVAVYKASSLANELFIRIAQRVRASVKNGRRVLFHCAGGTDRTGRVSLILELMEYGISREEVRAYAGPLSDPKIDLIVVDYLLSQRAGTKPEFRYLFPDLKKPEKSWLFLGLSELHAGVQFPIFEDWRD